MNIAIDFVGKKGPKYSVFYADENGNPAQPIFTPHAKQIEFFDAKEPYVLYGGGRGGGKTAAIAWNGIFKAYLLPESRVMIFRRTMGELKKTLVDYFQRLPKGIYEKCTEDAVTFENGSKIWFGSADDEKAVRKLLSGEYDLEQFDEWSEWPLSMWKFAAGSCRSTRDRDIFGRPYAPQVVGGTNPGGVGGATLDCLFGCSGPKKQAPGEDPTLYNPDEYRFIQSLVSDNPAYAEGTPAGDAYRRMLNSQPRRIRAAWLEGRWDGFEGQYFENLDEATAKLPFDVFLRLIRKQHWAPHWMSIDWGSVHHAYIAWHALLEIGGRQIPVTYDEYLVKGLGEAALAEEAVDRTLAGPGKGKIVKIYLSPDTFGESSFSRARRMGNVFVTYHMPRPVPANNKREDGWRLMHDLLGESHNVEIEQDQYRDVSGWLITDNCEHAWQSLPQAVCDSKKDGDVIREGDAPHLDVNDGLRYGIASHIHPKTKPFEDRVKEELEELPVAGPDRYIKHMQMIAKEKKEGGDVFYLGGNRGRR
jgi:phage terminase large subunit